MAAIIRKLIESYHYINDDLADPRTVNYPMVSTPFIIIAIVAVYNIFVQCVGPWWMAGRKPYNLKPLIVLYDCIQIVVNFWLCFRVLTKTYLSGKYNIFCQGVETGTSPEEVLIMNTVYYYFLTKILDLLDTVFFFLSKKSKNISFLHIYHHSGMVVCGWIGIKYIPGGQAIFFGALNGFVHGVMYTYYLLAALQFLDSRHVFWKRSLTQLQMLQFGLMTIHMIFAIMSPECGFPRLLCYFVIGQQAFIFLLFADFYRKTYLKKKKTS
ncbi:elongation of very long chain fatty acids protein AAEL008004-like [Homalodisca vitripennis]|uniref:Elongation of very long chain fatty acids protein n=1 Tax=Homalodisca liturata TaxID=320908 RepID=A0A1B6HKG7_9HEMI|nr:elongation of very long chain fatty acids protein AAEL008004-like [Homalodisca vitripennis]